MLEHVSTSALDVLMAMIHQGDAAVLERGCIKTEPFLGMIASCSQAFTGGFADMLCAFAVVGTRGEDDDYAIRGGSG